MDLMVARMQASEEILGVWKQSGFLGPFSRSAGDLEFPSALCRDRFEDQVTFRGFGPLDTAASGLINSGSGRRRVWGPAPAEVEDQVLAPEDLRLLEDLFEEIAWLEHPKCKIHVPVPVWLDPVGRREWRATMQLSAGVKLKNGQVGHLQAKFDLDWRLQEGSDWNDDVVEQEWRIFRWACRSMEFQQSDLPLFEEVLDQLIPDPQDLERARRSVHEEMIVEFLEEGSDWKKPYPAWQPSAGQSHPSSAVVDFDRDGFDDFYIQERSGRNMMFHNQGDGTFKEVAADLGLDFDGQTSCAMFVDLDNDGDLDAFLGGLLERSKLLENVDGRWVDRSGEWIDPKYLPHFISGLNAVDYDNDGLLDLYCSTYAARFVNMTNSAIRGDFKAMPLEMAENYIRRFILEEDFDKLHGMISVQAETMDIDTNRPGPPNVLLRNLGGGRFEPAPDVENIRIFRNCYDSAWADYDNDGDADLYCANDFAPNYLFRNEGDGTFTDVSVELGVVDLGFGMGVSWGDYDNDGLQDLYVTNMFSKAAQRVTSFFTKEAENFDAELLAESPTLDPLYRALGAGNSLFRNEGGDQPWSKVSGLKHPKLPVEPGGWGWGAQFADFDNDTWLDIYAPAGFYTAPEQAAIDVDL